VNDYRDIVVQTFYDDDTAVGTTIKLINKRFLLKLEFEISNTQILLLRV